MDPNFLFKLELETIKWLQKLLPLLPVNWDDLVRHLAWYGRPILLDDINDSFGVIWTICLATNIDKHPDEIIATDNNESRVTLNIAFQSLRSTFAPINKSQITVGFIDGSIPSQYIS